MFETPSYRWADPAWREAAEAWIHEAVAQAGAAVTGPVTGVRFLPWSAVLRVPTANSTYYFKECGPSQGFEPALAEFLAGLRPDCMIAVAAVDVPRQRLLMSDGGPTLTTAIRQPGDGPTHWRRILALSAGVQQELIPHATHLLALGVPDRRPVILPDLYRGLLAQPQRLRIDEPGGLTSSDLRDLDRLANRIDTYGAELRESGLPETYVQDDLHEDHIFAARSLNGEWRYTYFDYGDACVGHPFLQLVSRPRFVAGRYGIDGDSDLAPLFEAYLSHWADYATATALRRALDIALALGGIIRVMTWVNACRDQLDQLSPFLLDAYTTGVAFWLRQVQSRVERLDGR